MDGEFQPRFVLSASDRHAAALVNLWAAMQRLDPGASDAAVLAAETRANEMVEWLMARGVEPSGVNTLAHGLAVLAELCGAVVTIEQRPLSPLAMGNYQHEVSVRLKLPRGD